MSYEEASEREYRLEYENVQLKQIVRELLELIEPQGGYEREKVDRAKRTVRNFDTGRGEE